MSERPVVVKVGGSLYDLPDLGPRLRHWLACLDERRVLLVPGGGGAADVIREWDRIHKLGAAAAHWLALRSLTLCAHFLRQLLPEAEIATNPDEIREGCRQGCWVIDPFAFAAWDEGRPGSLPHTWHVTSDSVAARLAVVGGARRLFLLKSAAAPAGTDWAKAALAGYVDPLFPQVLRQAREAIEVVAVAFRAAP